MKKLFCLLALLLACNASYAKEEIWYTYWDIGMANHSYPGDANAAFNALEELPGVDRSQFGFNMLGFYLPLPVNNLMGFVINSSADRFDIGEEYVQLNQYTYSLSTMKFFGSEIGDGVFFRLDAGVAKAVAQSSVAESISSDSGFGFLAALGVGLPISEGTRILLSGSYSQRRIEGESTSVTALNLGFLF